MMDSGYEDLKAQKKRLDERGHRNVTGGNWEQIGQLQFDALKAHGLQPHHNLIDVGCGTLRGGVHFIPYLEPGRYYGLDANEDFVRIAYDAELNADLRARCPLDNFRFNMVFDFDFNDVTFDFACGISLFTHLSTNKILLCLENLRPLMRTGAAFCATFFLSGGAPKADAVTQVGRLKTYSYQNPFHYDVPDIEAMARGTGWHLSDIKDINHPRRQQLAVLIAD